MALDRGSAVQRRLAAILSADAAGYSRLMGDDEVATVRTLTTCRNLVADIIVSHNGRVVDSPGDNILEVLKRNPAFTVTGNLLPTLHYKRAGDLEHHRDSLSMAGLPR